MGSTLNSVLEYESAVKSDKVLLVVHGTTSEVAKAKETLDTTQPAHLVLHAEEELLATR